MRKTSAEASRHVIHVTSTGDDARSEAHEAGLRYVTDGEPGIQRKRAGKGFRYVGSHGRPIHDRSDLERIRCLG
ncbi:MAG TPA: hypothetical protein VHI51_12650, partial [Ktedonobacterales bacterium]|nr:hypothetical protein [Ktedonobacterales bacterium]